jgi:hypothetical protein
MSYNSYSRWRTSVTIFYSNNGCIYKAEYLDDNLTGVSEQTFPNNPQYDELTIRDELNIISYYAENS